MFHTNLNMLPEEKEAFFTEKLFAMYEGCQKYLIPKSKYCTMISDLKMTSEDAHSKTRRNYYLLAKFEILLCGDVEKLIKKRENSTEPPLFYVTIEDTFDIINRAHLSTGHGGRDRMLKELQKKYANITTKSVELLKTLCKECQKKTKRPMTKGIVVRPILTKDFASRGQVDLIDMQSMEHLNYKWIMVYQDHLTKFCVLRSLTSKRAFEVAHQLVDVFLLFGAPAILQSDNGSEFTANIISELKKLWPEMKLVHGKPRHPQSQGSVERANGDIKDMLIAWLSDKNCQDWTMGLKFVQFQKNSAYHFGIKCSPYSAMFGSEARIGLTSSSLPNELISNIETEDSLYALFEENADGEAENTQLSCDIEIIDDRVRQITERRREASIAQREQAERMVKRSRVDLKAGTMGDNVALPIPAVDRGRGDARNILGIVVSKTDNDQYKIAVKSGLLKGHYSRNQFDLCPQRLLVMEDVRVDKAVSLREAVSSESSSGGQGFTKCNCSGTKRCITNRCKCFKAKLKCNSRCHHSATCCNK